MLWHNTTFLPALVQAGSAHTCGLEADSGRALCWWVMSAILTTMHESQGTHALLMGCQPKQAPRSLIACILLVCAGAATLMARWVPRSMALQQSLWLLPPIAHFSQFLRAQTSPALWTPTIRSPQPGVVSRMGKGGAWSAAEDTHAKACWLNKSA